MLRLRALVLALVVAGCAPVAPSFDSLDLQGRALPVPVRLYNGIAWLSADRIAMTDIGDPPDGSRIVLVDSRGTEVVDVTPAARPECLVRDFFAVARAAAGDLGFAESCQRDGEREVIEFHARDPETGAARNLGSAVAVPFDAAWAADGSIVYAAGDLLCSTLYRRADTDRPLEMDVEVDGQRFAAGQDITTTVDRCPTGGRAGFPAYAPDGETLAFMAAANGDTPPGQGLLDSSWTIFTAHDGISVPVLGGITDPRSLLWTSEGDRLLFGGRVAGRVGVWSVATDGSRLTLLSAVDAIDLDLRPDGAAIAAILSSKVLANGEYARSTDVVIIDLPVR